jgi:hypothetical protein
MAGFAMSRWMQFPTHLASTVLPPGVFAFAVQRVSWIQASILFSNGTQLEIAPGNKTDYLLVVQEGKHVLEQWQAQNTRLTGDHLM